MMLSPTRRTAWLFSAAMLVACEPAAPTGSDQLAGKPLFLKFANSEWTEPVNLGPTINSTSNELGASLSPDGLSLYFNSNRPGGLGGNDLWLSQRACIGCPWGAPINLGAPVNSTANEGPPTFSTNPHVMFFNSGRPGGHGGSDLYVAYRADPNDEFGWGSPVNLGTSVNTSGNESGAEYVEREEGRHATLYFVRGVIQQQEADIYAAPVTSDGQVLGLAAPVSELNHPTVNDGGMTVRNDGREIIFWSNRDSPEGLVRGDLFVSTRHNVHGPWSTPRNLGAPVNSEFDEINASLSADGRTLIITSNRTGGIGGIDLWESTRKPGNSH